MRISLKANGKHISLDRYAGEWVAFASGKVVAHGETLERLMKRVRRNRFRRKPSVLLVPEEDDVAYII
jgi:hypothetical protein